MRSAVLAFALLVAPSLLAAPTKWEFVDKSIETLLNEGWHIDSHTPRETSNGLLLHHLVLSRGGKYLLCTLHPTYGDAANRAAKPATSTCDAMN